MKRKDGSYELSEHQPGCFRHHRHDPRYRRYGGSFCDDRTGEKAEKLGRFGKFLHDAVNFKFLIVEKILQALYIFVTAYVILCGFFMLFMAPETWTGRHWLGGYGILLMVLGPIAVRLCYELLMMAVLLLKNVISITAS